TRIAARPAGVAAGRLADRAHPDSGRRAAMSSPTTTPALPAVAAGATAPPPRNLGVMVLDAAARHPGVALRYRRGPDEISVSYPELGSRVTELARGLIALGIKAGDRVAIFADTCAEWTIADYGILCAGAVVAPVYHTSSAEECAYVLGHSGARAVFCGDAEQAAKVARIRDRCPDLEHVILFAGPTPGATSVVEICERGLETSSRCVSERLAAIGPGDLATLVYTSGTTGPPKGCMLTHANMLETARMYVEELGIDDSHMLYQFLPLAHVMARVAQAVVIRAGAGICFWGGDASKIIEELAELQPTHFPAVPRVYEKIYGAVLGKMQDGSAAQRTLFEWAVRRGAHARAQARSGRPLRGVGALPYRLADQLVLSKVRGVFGERLELALVGAAAVAPELLEFFDACGVLVLEGYGMTESCSVATLNTAAAVRFGTVGRPLPGTEVSVAPDGEILIRGPQVFRGYYHDPAATEEALTADGWLRSGDLGTISDDGFVAITGRKKDLIITSSGKNVTPVNIESQLRDTRYITEAVVFGDGRPYLVAMVTLDRDESAKLARRLGITGDSTMLAVDPRVRDEIQRDVDAVNAKLARIEQIKRFAILDHDLSQAGGELTPTLKVKRAVVYDKYAGLFSDLYGEVAG
ncbi:MAG: long-chain fatty acid--CoA ligase, partial [Solirubrobacteraceae bacterium]